jgi:hypothetical protein
VGLALRGGRPALAALLRPGYRSKLNPFLGRNFEAMDPLEWLARISDHIPDPGQHRTLSSPEAQKPPPLREVLRVAEHGEGWGVPAD